MDSGGPIRYRWLAASGPPGADASRGPARTTSPVSVPSTFAAACARTVSSPTSRSPVRFGSNASATSPARSGTGADKAYHPLKGSGPSAAGPTPSSGPHPRDPWQDLRCNGNVRPLRSRWSCRSARREPEPPCAYAPNRANRPSNRFATGAGTEHGDSKQSSTVGCEEHLQGRDVSTHFICTGRNRLEVQARPARRCRYQARRNGADPADPVAADLAVLHHGGWRVKDKRYLVLAVQSEGPHWQLVFQLLARTGRPDLAAENCPNLSRIQPGQQGVRCLLRYSLGGVELASCAAAATGRPPSGVARQAPAPVPLRPHPRAPPAWTAAPTRGRAHQLPAEQPLARPAAAEPATGSSTANSGIVNIRQPLTHLHSWGKSRPERSIQPGVRG